MQIELGPIGLSIGEGGEHNLWNSVLVLILDFMFSHRSLSTSENPVMPVVGEPSDGDSWLLTLSQTAFWILFVHNFSQVETQKRSEKDKESLWYLASYCDTW